MRTRTLGSDLEVSALGLGCMGMTHAYGAPADKDAMIRLLAEAVETGYTFFDTAELYVSDDGTEHNEDLVGQGLRPHRDQVSIATKFGIQFGSGGFIYTDRPEQIRRSLETSLRRLRTDRIDLYYLHRHNPDTPIEDVAAVMAELIDEGKILHWGLSEVDEATLRRAHALCPVTAVQSRLSMMYRANTVLFPAMEELGVGFVAFSPLANGLLSDKYGKDSAFGTADFRADMPQFRPDAFDANAALLELVRRLADETDATPAAVPLAWMLAKKPYIVPIPGTRSLERLRENASSTEIVLSAAQVAEIDEALNRMTTSRVFGDVYDQEQS